MKFRNHKGFTLIEVIVVAAIIAILAGILVPMIFGQIDESRKVKALGDAKAISTAIMTFKKDNACWPNRTNGADRATNTIQVLMSEGNNLDLAPMGWNGAADGVLNQLKDNGPAYPTTTWKGPYMTSELTADPWGNKYLVGAKNFDETPGVPSPPVWVISAGPDGILQTQIDSAVCFDGKSIDPISGTTALGDDICVRIK